MKPNQVIHYQFQRRHIRDHDVSSFVETFDIPTIPKVALPSYCGGLQLEIEYGEEELRQPYLIPEVRSFCRQLEETWPYVAFCCELRSPFVLVHTLSQLNHVSAIDAESAPRVCVNFAGPELAAVITRGVAQIQKTGRRARMSKLDIMARKTSYVEYLIQNLRCQSSE
jgi:hypothetical protein